MGLSEKEKNLIIPLIFISLIFVIIIILFFSIDLDSRECSYSEFNPSNMTGGTKVFGRCYVPFVDTYESTQKCGLFGISCYETKPYIKMYSGELCFKLKTGDRC